MDARCFPSDRKPKPGAKRVIVNGIDRAKPARSEIDRDARANQLFDQMREGIYRRTDRMFAGLMVFQWIAGIVAALVIAPTTWAAGKPDQPPCMGCHFHRGSQRAAAGRIGADYAGQGDHSAGDSDLPNVDLLSPDRSDRGANRNPLPFFRLAGLPRLLSRLAGASHRLDGGGGRTFARRDLFSARALCPTVPEPWLWMVHVGWVAFEDVFLIISIVQSLPEMKGIAEGRAGLEMVKVTIEREAETRTASNT